jgi:hypothetical protein
VVYGHDKFDLVAVFDGHNGPDVSMWAGHVIGQFFARLLETMEPAEALKQVGSAKIFSLIKLGV